MLSLAKMWRIEWYTSLILVLLANSVHPTILTLLNNATDENDLGSATESTTQDIKEYSLTTGKLFTNASSSTIHSKNNWNSERMPNPRTCPSCCGISQRGWICDPDGVFQYKLNSTELKLADQLNDYLWRSINSSVCPCQNSKCHEWNVTIYVAVVRKLPNPNNYSAGQLIYNFAQSLLEMWRVEENACRTEIIIALSIEDSAMTTVLGRDITLTGMMRYEDVTLIGGITQTIVPDANLFATLRFLITTYGLYINHPIQSINHGNVTDNPPETDFDGDAMQPGIIALIVLAVVLITAALVIVALPFYCKSGIQVCKKEEKPEI